MTIAELVPVLNRYFDDKTIEGKSKDEIIVLFKKERKIDFLKLVDAKLKTVILDGFYQKYNFFKVQMNPIKSIREMLSKKGTDIQNALLEDGQHRFIANPDDHDIILYTLHNREQLLELMNEFKDTIDDTIKYYNKQKSSQTIKK